MSAKLNELEQVACETRKQTFNLLRKNKQ